MRKLFNIAALFTMLAACVSCSDSFENSKAVRFSVKTGDPGTKVSYSGYKESNKERVDWTNGDMVWIYSPESERPTSKEASYVIRDVNPNGYYSEAGLDLYSTEGTIYGLQWNDDVDLQHFFAVYPAPLQNRSVFFRMAMNQGQWDASCSVWYGATIPTSQPPVNVTDDGDGNYLAEPDGHNLIMAAQDVCEPNTLVHLDFEPVVTAVEFVVKNGYPENGTMNLQSIKLTADSDPIVGKFTNYLAGSGQTSFENTSTNLEIPFSTPLSIANGKTLKFTVFMLGLKDSTDPDIDNVTIEFVTTGADANTTNSIKAKLKTTQGVMAFPRGKKSYVTGFLIPGASAWTISAVPNAITAWDPADEETVEVSEPNPGTPSEDRE